MKIQLNKDQVEKAMELAKKRHDAKDISFRNKDVAVFENEKKKLLAKKTKTKSEYMSHYIGILGEFGWAIANNLKVDENIYAVRDSGEDFDGVEIKTITYFGTGEPELKITQKEYFRRKKPKVYVLARISIDRDEIEILGKITRNNFDKLKIEKQYGRNLPKNYVVPLSLMEKL